jgi:hypothetical protein
MANIARVIVVEQAQKWLKGIGATSGNHLGYLAIPDGGALFADTIGAGRDWRMDEWRNHGRMGDFTEDSERMQRPVAERYCSYDKLGVDGECYKWR